MLEPLAALEREGEVEEVLGEVEVGAGDAAGLGDRREADLAQRRAVGGRRAGGEGREAEGGERARGAQGGARFQRRYFTNGVATPMRS